MARGPDVVVVGAGVFGAWTAYELRAAGRSVVLLDAFGAGHSRASSGGESRVIRLGYGDRALYSRWAQRSLARWHALLAEARQPLLVRTGVLWLGRHDDPMLEATERTLAEIDAPHQRLSRAEVTARFPAFALAAQARGVLEPDSGVLLARRAVDAVVQHGVRHGVDYRVAAVAPPGDDVRRLRLSDGSRVTADVVVYACGPWLPALFPTVLGPLLHVTRQEVFFFGAAPGDRRFAPPAMPAWVDFGRGVYGVPDLEGRGLKVGLDTHGAPFDPDAGDRLPSATALYTARQRGTALIPSLAEARLLDARVCQYTNTGNGDFLIDRHPDDPQVWLVGGGSGHGFKHGPAVGAYVASLIDGTGVPVPELGLAGKRRERTREVY